MLNKMANLSEDTNKSMFILFGILGLLLLTIIFSVKHEQDITNSLIHQTEVIMANKKEIKTIEPYKDIYIKSSPNSITLSYVKHRFETSHFPLNYLESLTISNDNIKSVSINGTLFSGAIIHDSQMIDNLTNTNKKNTIVINY